MFEDREDAAKQLASKLGKFKGKDAVVLALPRGGVVLGAVLARRLSLPLGLILVKKISHPLSPEYAVGALTESGQPEFNQAEASLLDAAWLEQSIKTARQLIKERRGKYYKGLKPPKIKGKTAIVVDDGVATGLTMMASLNWLKSQGAKRLVMAVPVAPADSLRELERIADETVVLEPSEKFLGAVGSHYRRFGQVGDEEVKKILAESYRKTGNSSP